MTREEAKRLIEETFQRPFDEERFRYFIRNLLNDIDESKAFEYHGPYIKDSYKEHIKQYKRIGKYTDPEGNELDVLTVHLKKKTSLDRARTMQRNFVAHYLKKRGEKDAALVAFYNDKLKDWRFSFVRMEYRTVQTESGRVKVREELTPARRYSFLVGENEPNHTAQQQLVPILEDDRNNPGLADLEEAFNIETVTREFFLKYRGLFLKVKEELDEILSGNRKVRKEFESKQIDTANFAKKLLGQIVFLYFLQKKGWLGVEKGKPWGTGPRNFMRKLFEKEIVDYSNYFNDILEPLFYEALAIDRGEDSFYERFNCKIPFLNGGFFEPIGDYDWRNTDILLENETFREILDTFDLYNFTVREDDPLEKEVAVDPEMLGKVFENLLEVKDRKSKGAYYTPREIVHYMCQESLINYLDTAINTQEESLAPQKAVQKSLIGDEEPEQPALTTQKYEPIVPRKDIEEFIRHGEFAIDNDTAKIKGTKSYSYKLPERIRKHAKLIDEKLAGIKICDPAIGSGAFPVGMMHEVVKARQVLTTYLGQSKKRTAYYFKRHAIQNSIYGVDIDPGAIDIAKLRLWLSLIVDEDDYRSIKPLPNLDYKIVCGNSLLGVEQNLLNNHLFRELEKLKPQYFEETDPEKKKELKARIDSLIKEITNNDEHFDFKVYFSEVFHKKGGFDVVFGNPPYIGFQNINKSIKKVLRKYFCSAEGKFDLYIPFIEKSFYLLKKEGFFIFICPSSFTKRSHGMSIRKFLLHNTTLYELIDFGHTQMFDQATNYTCIFSFLKSKKDRNKFKYRNSLYEQPISLEQVSLKEDPWLFLNSIDHKIVIKIQQHPKLGDIAKISEGVVTGLNSLYLLKEDSIKENEFESNCFVPCYRGKDIEKYYIKKCSEYLFYPYTINNEKTVPIDESILSSSCPKYLEFLRKNMDLIKKRKYFIRSKKRWYELWNQRDLSIFNANKIITPELSDCNRFALAPSKYFYGDTVCGIVLKNDIEKQLNIKYVLAVLNSSLIEWFYKKTTVPKAGGFFIYKVMFLKNIPIKIISLKEQQTIIDLVDQIIERKQTSFDTDISDLEEIINEKIFKLYGLEKEEIEVIKGRR
jgi:methylase of polypeptide subunit release factors